jgi:hypothetical protein
MVIRLGSLFATFEIELMHYCHLWTFFMPFACMLGDGPLEGLVGKLPDAIEKRIGGLGLNCPPNGWLDDIAKI